MNEISPRRRLAAVYLSILAGTALGALVGFGVQLVTSQAGWWLVGAAIGITGGAYYAADRLAAGAGLWPPGSRVPPA